MSYFFPHATREATRQKTVNDFEKHCQIAIDIRDRLLSEFIEYVPLFDKLVAIKREEGELDWGYEKWKDIYAKNGWTEVEGQPQYRSGIDIKDYSDITGKEIKREEPKLIEGSEKWNEFVKIIDGITYRNSYPEDQQMYWQWFWWNFNTKNFQERLELIKASSYDLDFLDKHDDSIYFHEAFLVIMGVSPDKMKRDKFKSWLVMSISLKVEELDYFEAELEWFKKEYTEFEEWQILLRRFGKNKDFLNDRTGLELEIDTQEFIEWALKNGIIEKDTAHFRDGSEAPFEASFTEMLHKELMAKKLIKQGKHHHTWVWASTKNAYNYLVRSLFENQTPKNYWIDEPYKRKNARWEPWQHYFGNDISRPQNQTTEPSNAPKIDLIVQKLIVEHDKGNINGFKYPKCT